MHIERGPLMPRARLKPGTWGKVTRQRLTPDGVKPEKWEAVTNYRDLDGRLREVTATGPSGPKAESALKEKLAKRYKPTLGDGELTPETLIEVLAREWLKEVKNSKRATSTYNRYRNVTEGHIIKKGGGLTIDELSVARMERFFDSTKNDAGKPTAQLARVCLMGMFNLASRHGAARFGNLVKLTATITVDRKPVVALSQEQVRLVRKLMRADRLACRNGIADMIDLMLGTGARIGEVVVLRWHHFDLDSAKPTVLIEATAAWGAGKGVYAQPYPKKGPRARRLLVLPRWVVTMLLARRAQVPDAQDDLVFASRANTIRHPNNVREQISNARERAGLLELPLNPHTYRKTVGTRIGQQDIEKAASQLGHATSEITKRHYIEPTHEGPDARDYLDVFDENPE